MLKKEIEASGERKKPLVAENKTFLSADDFRVSNEDLEKARRELHETEEAKTKCLRELKDRLSKNMDLQCRMDDDYLLRYVRYGKYNVDRAYSAICNFYSLRKNYPDCFALTDRLESLLRTGYYSYLPYRDEGGHLLAFMKISEWNTSTMSFNDIAQIMSAIFDMFSSNPAIQIHGCIAIWDMKGANIRQAVKLLYPSNLRVFTNILQNVYPWRIKGVILFNCNSLVQRVYKVMQPFIKKKVADRLKFLGSDVNELHKYVNPVLLPKEYEGSLDEREIKSVIQHILDNLPYIRYERSFGYI